jgi:serine phosphatase RsbU (regulator of sigma subunit)
VEQFGGDGLPLAIMPGEVYSPSRTFRMERGDVLVMLTDGVIEWRNGAGVQFGDALVASELKSGASEPAAAIVDRLHKAVLAHAVGRQADG